MAITYAAKSALITKHAKKFVWKKDNAGRPELRGVYYAPNGDAIASNRHYLLRIKEAHNIPEPTVIDAHTGLELPGPYPDTKRILELEYDKEIVFTLSEIEMVIPRIKVALDIAKKLIESPAKLSRLNLHNNTLSIEIHEAEIEYRASLIAITATGEVEPSSWLLNIEYLYNAFSVFKDARSREITLKLKEPTAPIMMTDEENGIDIVIAPGAIR